MEYSIDDTVKRLSFRLTNNPHIMKLCNNLRLDIRFVGLCNHKSHFYILYDGGRMSLVNLQIETMFACLAFEGGAEFLKLHQKWGLIVLLYRKIERFQKRVT